MIFDSILYEKRGKIAYITINRPEKLNALHAPANMEMKEAFTDFANDEKVWVAILTGTGDKSFSAGNDLRYHAENVKKGEAYPQASEYPFGGITSNFTCWKPIIAAVNGYALGGGLELAMACDIIIAAENAKLGLPEARVGVVAGAGAVHFLPRQIPRNIALGMLFTGKSITATEAFNFGLLNEVVTSNNLISRAERWASEILKCSPLAIRATKQMALDGLDRPLKDAMNRSYSEYTNALLSKDYIEGPKAFSEKRTPEWLGK